ncbi:hypothetical protein CDG77_00070 [Nostoc sp. 'Peltigera membranacea cyanobiont' 213]|uniref:hypothetical protein n=1 Tax=unclassified Nostoc TaxID=2593658 RepID=UPI000B955CD2|nr:MULTISPECIES: hypothetical protein [unclassified Nostoc]OYD99577.1 hypothetical protein CDG77_00070 [Nostoc sp. 'Peltigera membranacea cyanobiont' 213]
MSTTGYAYAVATDKDTIQFDFITGYLTKSSEKTGNISGFALPCLRANRPLTLNKTLTIDDINIPDLTING